MAQSTSTRPHLANLFIPHLLPATRLSIGTAE
jgi:hypothetical protein